MGAKLRESSPRPGSSILMTSAPRSARFIVQKGPASTRVRSSTQIPASGLFSIIALTVSPQASEVQFFQALRLPETSGGANMLKAPKSIAVRERRQNWLYPAECTAPRAIAFANDGAGHYFPTITVRAARLTPPL